ncbi:isoleucine--tRNA ligase [Chrysiogenes arsenatis]|uniref:isoleucine--tRNA ligase n=1 Tax=Chrysiogenes arsenatis TaxID=309797 RepID=UPI000405CC38|nr:isoleucine--tRNA ligase [Chrysiogenes arsenatis]
MELKDTLNLPVTDFQMRGNLPAKEPGILEQWDQVDLYNSVLKNRTGKPSFVLHDGPPYANGNTHIGHALNKTLKDIIIRQKTMEGFHVPYVPGWDCHGLPIELGVDKALGKKKNETPPAEKRKLCREHATKFIDIQRTEFKRLGILGEWENPYLTMNYQYEADIVRELGKFMANGSLYKGLKPIYWCPDCVTALAEAEVEYDDHTSHSIYVAFPVASDITDLVPSSAHTPTAIVIWTTTPWTLPANLGVALNPDLEYAAIEVGGRILIVAAELVEKLMGIWGIAEYREVARFAGAALEKRECHHPFAERTSLILLGDHVTLEAGTGAVHTAPGHGMEDYIAGMRYGLEPYNPVDDHGILKNDVLHFAGMHINKANPLIIEKLSELGYLLGSAKLQHSYPHCWRCKNPVIYRATPQWFISMETGDLRKNALSQIRDHVQWIPAWGQERIYNMIANRPDWCVSRQRLWGVPITVLYCASCEEPLSDMTVFEKAAAAIEADGVDAWYDRPASDFIADGTTCPHCGHDSFRKEKDILDVWFDSGVSHAAVMERRGLGWPADLYLEGSDQHRGWFHSSLLTAVATRGAAPYKSVLTHGFVLDGKGRKMSKSVGNVVAPDQIIKKFGADILRLWVAAEDYRDDLRISDEIMNRLAESYRRIRNTARYMLGNLYDFNPATDLVAPEVMVEFDRFALARYINVEKKVLSAYSRYEFHVIYHAFNNLCSVDLSVQYLDVIKDRLYASKADSPERRSAQSVLYLMLDSMTRLLAPILCFTAEEIYGFMPGDQKATSVHLLDFPATPAVAGGEALIQKWEKLMKIRGDVMKALEVARVEKVIGHSLEAAVTLCGKDLATNEILQMFTLAELRDVFIISQIAIDPALNTEPLENGLRVAVTHAKGEKCSRCWMYSEETGAQQVELCPRCAAVLQS